MKPTLSIRPSMTHMLAASLSAALLVGCSQTPPPPSQPAVPAPAPAAAAKPVGPRDAGFLPLGVYWPGECTFGEYQVPAVRWQWIDRALGQLASNHVNAIWLTHLDAKFTAEFARHAAQRGIYLVASLGELAGDIEHVRKADHRSLITSVLTAWGDAPKPIAWGLGDEPRNAYMDEMKKYAAAWKQHAPGEPTTTVVMWGDVASAGKAGFDALCADVYPFFSAGNPNGYPMPPALAWTSITKNVMAQPARPWMMGQAYQEAWGPFDLDEQGNIVYLPGGAPHWVMPTPTQIKWQAWAAFASGSKGMFYFLYRWPIGKGNPTGEPAKLPAAAKERTDSGAPRSLVYDDLRPTAQFTAMSEAYRQIQQHAGLLAKLKLTPEREAWVQAGLNDGNVANVFIHTETGQRYLIAVGSFNDSEPVTFPVRLAPHITALRHPATGQKLVPAAASTGPVVELQLPPGEGALFECVVDTAPVPAS